MPLDLSEYKIESVIAEFLSAQFLLTCVDVSTLAVWAVDYFDTLHLEVSVMWAYKQSSIVGYLFYVLRYLPVFYIGISLTLHTNIVSAQGISTCRWQLALVFLLGMLCVLLGGAMVFIRVFGIGGASQRLKVYLICHSVVTVPPLLCLLIKEMTTIQFFPPPPGYPTSACTFVTFEGKYLSMAWAIILANELWMMALTFFFVFKCHVSLRNPIIEVFYRSGSVYMAGICAVSTANIVLPALSPKYAYLFTGYQVTLHAVFATRMVMKIREAAKAPTVITFTDL